MCLRIRGTNISWCGNIQMLLETCGCYTTLGEWVEPQLDRSTVKHNLKVTKWVEHFEKKKRKGKERKRREEKRKEKERKEKKRKEKSRRLFTFLPLL